MTFADYENCPDFSSARPDAPELKIPFGDRTGAAARQFSQGYIHAGQNRTDLLGQSADYDAGFAARNSSGVDDMVSAMVAIH